MLKWEGNATFFIQQYHLLAECSQRTHSTFQHLSFLISKINFLLPYNQLPQNLDEVQLGRLAQGVSRGCSQGVSGDCCHLKQEPSVPPSRSVSIWLFLTWLLAFPRANDPGKIRESNQNGCHHAFYNPILEMIQHHFCHVLLVTQTTWNNMRRKHLRG